MKQSNEVASAKQSAQRGVARGKKVNSIGATTDPGAGQQTFSPEEQHCLIAEAAYYRALKRGFTPGCEMDDWLQAEAEVNHVLHMPKSKPS